MNAPEPCCAPSDLPPPLVPLPTDPDEALALLAKALGHPARVRILRFLLNQPGCFAGAIVDHLPLAPSTVSQHLKVLREVGFVRGEVDGPHICYCADEGRIQEAGALLEQLTSLTPAAGGHTL